MSISVVSFTSSPRAPRKVLAASSRRVSRMAARALSRYSRNCICDTCAVRNGRRALSGSACETFASSAAASPLRRSSIAASAVAIARSISSAVMLSGKAISGCASTGSAASLVASPGRLMSIPATVSSGAVDSSELPNIQKPIDATATIATAPIPRILGLENGEPPILSRLIAGVGPEVGSAAFSSSRLPNFSPMFATMPVIVSVKLESSPSNAAPRRSYSGDGVISICGSTTAGCGAGVGFGAGFG